MSLKTWTCRIVPALLLLALPALSMAQVSLNISVNVPPPELPVYEQPPIPQEGYLWTPGYWAWGDDIQDYYWVPGTWVEAPQPGYLWTPGYWGSQGGVFLWNAGYWGPHVGFYGGVNYGYGYGGSGFEGGEWRGGRMYYNRSVTNISTTNVTNVYNKTVINNVTVTHVSYNGGNGGVRAQPSSRELEAAHEQHVAFVPAQRQHEQTARGNPELRASNNKGKPPIAATARPGSFSGAGVVAAKVGGKISTVQPNPAAHAAQSEERPATHAAPLTHEAGPPSHVPTPPVHERAQSIHEPAPPVHEPAPPIHEPAPPVHQAAPAFHERAPPVHEPAPPVHEPAPPPHEMAPHPVPREQAQVEHPVAPRPSAPPRQEVKPNPAPHAAEHPEDRDHH
jgi:WXXGXW repeat (2 copies)